MERTEESRGGLSRRLGDPVREPAPGTVATGSLGGRDSETGKREGKWQAEYPRKRPAGRGQARRMGRTGWRGVPRRERLGGDGEGTSPAWGRPGSRLAGAGAGGGGGRCVIMAGAAGAATAAESSAGNRAWLGGPAAIGQGATKVPRS